jgi:hypothetical protein
VVGWVHGEKIMKKYLQRLIETEFVRLKIDPPIQPISGILAQKNQKSTKNRLKTPCF